MVASFFGMARMRPLAGTRRLSAAPRGVGRLGAYTSSPCYICVERTGLSYWILSPWSLLTPCQVCSTGYCTPAAFFLLLAACVLVAPGAGDSSGGGPGLSPRKDKTRCALLG
jgi:hypothetical protein